MGSGMARCASRRCWASLSCSRALVISSDSAFPKIWSNEAGRVDEELLVFPDFAGLEDFPEAPDFEVLRRFAERMFAFLTVNNLCQARQNLVVRGSEEWLHEVIQQPIPDAIDFHLGFSSSAGVGAGGVSIALSCSLVKAMRSSTFIFRNGSGNCWR